MEKIFKPSSAGVLLSSDDISRLVDSLDMRLLGVRDEGTKRDLQKLKDRLELAKKVL